MESDDPFDDIVICKDGVGWKGRAGAGAARRSCRIEEQDIKQKGILVSI